MTDARGLLLGLYAAFSGAVLLAGFVWKEIRDYRKRHKKPEQLEFHAEHKPRKTHAAMTH